MNRLPRPVLLRVLVCALLACVAWQIASGAVPRHTEIVAIYFPGYHQDDHYDSWFGEGWNEWRLLAQAPQRFPGQRILRPAWGDFDEADPGWMAKQVGLAGDNSIDVFLFDWYWYSGVKLLERPLERGFLQATNQGRLKFALMWANHDWRNYFPAPSDQDPPMLLPARSSSRDFSRMIDYCLTSYFIRTNYWRVSGAVYFGVFETDKLIEQLGGPAATRKALEAARQQVRRAGVDGIHFAAFHSAPVVLPKIKEAGFDSVTTYNLTSSGKATLPDKPLDQYSDLVDSHTEFWKSMDTGILPYMPIVTLGWDCTPRWTKDAPFPPQRNAYPYGSVLVSNTPAEFARLVRLAQRHVRSSPSPPPGILVNAWNEWTEGSALLPERVYGTAFLDALKNSVNSEP